MTLELHMKSQESRRRLLFASISNIGLPPHCSRHVATNSIPATEPAGWKKDTTPNPSPPSLPHPPFLHGLIDHTIRILQKHPNRPMHPPPYHTPVGSTNPTRVFPPSPLFPPSPPSSTTNNTTRSPVPHVQHRVPDRRVIAQVGQRAAPVGVLARRRLRVGRGGAERKVKMVLAWLWERC